MKVSKVILASLLSGVLLIACYEPFNIWALAYFALLPLMFVTRATGCIRTAGYYGLTGTILGIGIYYGAIGYGVEALMLIVLSFTLAFALWGGLTSWVLTTFSSNALKIFIPAFIWVGIETLFGSSSLGVPMYLGLSHAGQPWLIQSASWFGISGISFLIVLSNSLISFVLFQKSKFLITPCFIASALLLANPLLGYWQLNAVSPALDTIRIAAVQPKIDSETYSLGWQKPENRIFMHDTLYSLTQKAVNSGAQMVFWAEGGNGHMNMRVPELRQSLASIARQGNVDLIISSSDMDSDGQRYNSLFSISPLGQVLGRYDKRRLLPMAESSLNPGVPPRPMLTSQGKLGSVICYESTFPNPLRDLTSQGAELLFVTSSEAAFKRSPLALHNAGLAVFRAVENQRWLIRAANTGPSIIVSPFGVITQQSGFYTRGILSGDVALQRQITLFTKLGYMLPEILAVVVVLLSLYIIFISVKRKHSRLNIEIVLQQYIAKAAGPLVMGCLIVAIVVMGSVSSSLYVVNQKFLDSQSTVSSLMSELFMPQKLLQIDSVGQNFMQAGNNTCGAAALAYTLSYLGRETDEDEIVKLVKLTERGTSMLELKQAAKQLRFSVKGVNANYLALVDEPLPVIAYINDDHYVVVIDVGYQYVNVFDPALGYVRLTRALFEQSWNGHLLLVHPDPIPKLIGGDIHQKKISLESRI